MKDSWFKVISIALAVALVFTIVTSNIVSITAISSLRKAKASTGTVVPAGKDSNEGKKNDDNNNTEQTNNVTTADTNDTTVADTTASSGSGSGSNNVTTTQPKTQAMSKAEILTIYKNAVNKVKNNGAAGYNKKEWQELPELAIGTNDKLNNFVTEKAANYMTTEDEAKVEENAKGSDDAKRRFPACTLTDVSKIQKATCEDKGTYYKITIVMQDDDTPSTENNILGEITNSVLYKEDIMKEVDSLKVVNIKSLSVLYDDFTITCEITKDGKFRSMKHFASVDISVSATILLIPLNNGKGKLLNHCEYWDFKY